MEAHEALAKMVLPSHKRQTMLGGICQIHVGRACDLGCVSCSQGSDLAGKVVFITPDDFETAVKSLGFGVPGQVPFFGVVGVFGGNAALAPRFGEYCEILRSLVPLKQRGLWCNHPRGKGKFMRVTFWPAHCNLNTHMSQEAHDEFVRDWPESKPYLKGLEQDSLHSSPWVALQDVEPDESKRWDMIACCDINRFWSSLVGFIPGRGLRAYLCEVAFAQALIHATASDADDWKDTGLEPVPGWWRKPIADFESQVRLHCMACGIPLRRPPKPALGCDAIEFSYTHRHIARPKTKDRPIEIIESIGMVQPSNRPSTEYLDGITPGYKAKVCP